MSGLTVKVRGGFAFIVLLFRFIRWSRRCKIFFFFPFYHTGGAEQVHLDIVKSFKKKSTITIFTLTSYNDHFLAEFKEYSHVFEFNRFLNNLYYRRALSLVLRHIGRSSKVHTLGCNSIYYYQILPVLNTKVDKIDLLHAFSRPGCEDFSLRFIPYIDTRVIINEKTREDYSAQYQQNKIDKKYLQRIVKISNAVDVPNFYDRTNFYEDPLPVIYCGRISPEKRVHLIIEIAEKLKGKTKVQIYGPKQIEISGLDEYYFGLASNKSDLSVIYQQNAVLLITSESEGFPMVMMEAMACGVVCIATDVGGISEHITNGENGFLVPSFEDENRIVDGFENIIKNLCGDRDLLKRISNNAYQYAKENFSRERFNEAYRQLLL